MRSSLLTRAAPVMMLSATLAAGMAMPGYAQTSNAAGTPGAAPQATSPAPSGTSAPAASGVNTTAPATTSGTTQASPQATSPGANATAQAAPGNGAPTQTLEQMAEQRIQELHTKLGITRKEEPKWNKFAQVMRSNARALDHAYQQRAEKIESMNALENMRSYASIERMRANDVQKLIAPFQSLYAEMSAQQKQQANELFRARAEAAQQRRQGAASRTQSGH